MILLSFDRPRSVHFLASIKSCNYASLITSRENGFGKYAMRGYFRRDERVISLDLRQMLVNGKRLEQYPEETVEAVSLNSFRESLRCD